MHDHQPRRSLCVIGALAVLGVLGSAGSARAAGQTCLEYLTMIDAMAPPEVGTGALVRAMLSTAVAPGSALSARFDSRAARRALDTRARGGRGCRDATNGLGQPLPCEYRDDRGTNAVLRVDLREGYVVFLDPSRSFDADGPDNDVTEAEALQVASSLLLPLGVEPAEVDSLAQPVRYRTMLSGPAGEPATQARRSEANVDLYRRVGGRRVYGSRLRVAVDNQRRAARVHLDWPDFRIVAGLATADTLSRSEVVSAAAEAIGETARCTSYSGVTTMIAWVRASELGFIDLTDQDGEASIDGYVPALVVSARGPLGDVVHPPDHPFTSQTRIVVVPLVTQGEETNG